MRTWGAFLLAALAVAVHAGTDLSAGKQCAAKFDLLLIVDKSASINDHEWKMEKQFLETLMGFFKIGGDNVRVSLLLFANHVRHQFHFNCYKTTAEVLQAIKNLQCKCARGQTVTGSALRWGRETALRKERGARDGVQKVVIVLTDGESTEKKSFVAEQAAFMKEAALVIVVGVGIAKPEHHAELEMIASTRDLVFKPKSFSALNGMAEAIAETTCEIGTEGIAGPSVETCHVPLDLLFLVDKSASLDDKEWAIEKKFVKQMASAFEVSPGQVQMSLSLFANHVHPKFDFGVHKTTDAVVQAIEDLTCPSCKKGATVTGSALKYGRLLALTEEKGARPGVKKIVVVVTDGECTQDKAFYKEQAALLKQDAMVIVVGVGVKNYDELALMASDESLVFKSDNFDDLEAMAPLLATDTCYAASMDQPTLVGVPADNDVWEGTDLTLTCQVPEFDEGVELTFKFYLDGKEIQNSASNKYEISSAKGAHTGLYTCTYTLDDDESFPSNAHNLNVLAKCAVPLDLLFLLDKSASINKQQWKAEKAFVQKFIRKFEVGPNKVKVATNIFANFAHEVFCFNDYTTTEACAKAVGDISCKKCKKGKTGTGKALLLGRTKSLTSACGSRGGVQKIVVVVTDGRSTDDKNFMANECKLMKEKADTVIAVGVGKKKKIDRKELELIATDKDLVFMATNFAEVEGYLNKITTSTCKAGRMSRQGRRSMPRMEDMVVYD